MHCATCGSPLEESVKFCAHCGAPALREGTAAQPGAAERIWSERGGADRPREGSAAASAALPATANFDFTAGALGVFFRSLAAIFAMMFVIPAPWIACWYARWFASRMRLSNGTALTFTGTPSSVAVVAMLYAIFILVSVTYQRDELSSNIMALAGIPLGWAVLRWSVNHAQLGAGSFRFDGSVWGYAGWTLLTYLSILTIVGWAWVMAAFYRWNVRHIRHAEGTLRFVGKGHQILWRLLVFILLCPLIVTIPWVIKWFFRWIVQQVEWERRDSPSAAAPYPAAL